MRVIRILRICLRIRRDGFEYRMVVDLDLVRYTFGIVDYLLCVIFFSCILISALLIEQTSESFRSQILLSVQFLVLLVSSPAITK
jgi:hypothetical protein